MTTETDYIVRLSPRARPLLFTGKVGEQWVLTTEVGTPFEELFLIDDEGKVRRLEELDHENEYGLMNLDFADFQTWQFLENEFGVLVDKDAHDLALGRAARTKVQTEDEVRVSPEWGSALLQPHEKEDDMDLTVPSGDYNIPSATINARIDALEKELAVMRAENAPEDEIEGLLTILEILKKKNK